MGPGAALTMAAKQAEQLRIDGNTYFGKSRYGAAIDAYTEAITLCPNVAVYWTNRALCHRKRNDWTKVEEDCRRAIQLDNNSFKDDHGGQKRSFNLSSTIHTHSQMNIDKYIRFKPRKKFDYKRLQRKARYMLGLALLQKEELAEGVKKLQKEVVCLEYAFTMRRLTKMSTRALDLGRGAHQKGYMVEEIWQELAKAKYLEWEQASTKRSWELQNQKRILERKDASNLKQLEDLQEVFKKAGENGTPTEVPDYLCCRISLDIFRDPVITPSRVSYEREEILDHLQKVGKFDPVSREPLDPSQLVLNLAIKAAVQSYLDKHGWAYKT